MAIDIGRIGYTAYVEHIEGNLFNGEMKKWEELSKTVQDAWRSAAVEILQYFESKHSKLGDLEDQIID